MNKGVLNFILESHLPNLFDPKFRLAPNKAPRQRLFTTQSFFLTMLHLVLGGNSGGYFMALLKAFTIEQDKSAPSASAFAQLRNKTSYRFFKVAVYKRRNRARL